MKAATGELNLTVITIIAIAAVIAFFWFFFPTIQNTINNTWGKFDDETHTGYDPSTGGH